MTRDDKRPRAQRIAAPLRQQAVEELRSSIVEQRYAPGERLIERVLMEDLEVSRTVVREVLRQLESEGLVEIVPYVGPRVRQLSPQEIRGLYQVRGVIEGLLARECAVNSSESDLAAIEAAHRHVVSTLESDVDLHERLQAKDELYAAIVAGSGNTIAGEVFASVQARVSLYRAATLSEPGRAPRTIEEVNDIVAAIRRGDADAAELAARAHVQAAEDVALASVLAERRL